MPKLKPLHAVRYTEGAGAPADLTCPPYDVISPARQIELYQRHPNNCIRLELTLPAPQAPGSMNRYEQAANTYADWIGRGILRQDEVAGYYLYRQSFQLAGKSYSRRGVIGGMLLEPLGGRVKPHERTLAKAKEDRLNLLRALHANTSPVFALFRDPGDALLEGLFIKVKGDAPQSFTDEDGVTHELWRLTDPASINAFESAVDSRTAYIADGHHRYEVGLEYAREQRAAHGGAAGPWDYLMTMLVNLDAPGLAILPTHRVVRKGATALAAQDLSGDFTVRPADRSSMDKITRGEMNPKAIGWYDGIEYRILIPKLPEIADRDASPLESPARRNLAVSILHNTILRRRMGIDTLVAEGQDRMRYIVAVDDAIGIMSTGDYSDAFFLAPTSIEEVCTVAEAGDVMPQKSTFFYPKLVSGLLFNPLST